MSYDDPQEEKEYHELKLPLNREYYKVSKTFPADFF